MILGVDLGERTTGLAVSEGVLASPHSTITHNSSREALLKISNICEELSVDTVVFGFVEGKIKSLFENFSQKFKGLNPNINIILWDETLSTRQARDTMVKLNISKKRREKREHEIAASIILQSYLDSK